jgi:hypothetical protein
VLLCGLGYYYAEKNKMTHSTRVASVICVIGMVVAVGNLLLGLLFFYVF